MITSIRNLVMKSNKISLEVLNSASHLASAVGEVSVSIDEVSNASMKLNDLVKELDEEINKFKI